MQPLIIGTAGHIDHGKSALVKALTGTDPDRLSEEQEKGMTIDIGFAFLEEQIAFIDVPGHEHFIKNMITGASTIDAVMLVISADDGVMPQTREHLDILSFLKVRSGLVVITKIDLVDKEWLKLVTQDVVRFLKGTFLEKAPLLKVSAVSGEGIKSLKNHLLRMGEEYTRPEQGGIARLPIDRVFTMRGYGTIVTGTVLSGSIKNGDLLEVLPAKKRVRVRAIQHHKRAVEAVTAGQRAALNLAGIERRELERGYFLAKPGFFRPTRRITVKMELLDHAPRLKYNEQLRVHLGTGEFIARIRWTGVDHFKPGETRLGQLEFDRNLAVGFRDLFILRRYSPMRTIGGGLVLDPCPAERLRKQDHQFPDRYRDYLQENIEQVVTAYFQHVPKSFVEPSHLSQRFTLGIEQARQILADLKRKDVIVNIGKGWILHQHLQQIQERLLKIIEAYHHTNPFSSGMPKPILYQELKLGSEDLVDSVVKQMVAANRLYQSGDRVALSDFRIRLKAVQADILQRVKETLLRMEFQPPEISRILAELKVQPQEIRAYIDLLSDQDEIVFLQRDMALHRDVIEKGAELVRAYLTEKRSATVSELKELLGTTRKWVLPLLNYYDENRLTYRDGDRRFLHNG